MAHFFKKMQVTISHNISNRLSDAVGYAQQQNFFSSIPFSAKFQRPCNEEVVKWCDLVSGHKTAQEE